MIKHAPILLNEHFVAERIAYNIIRVASKATHTIVNSVRLVYNLVGDLNRLTAN